MRQVLDIFDLLTQGPNGHQGVEWRLTKATTNSPFHLEGEAVSFEPTVDISVIARAQKQDVAKGLNEIAKGVVPEHWEVKRLNIANRLYERNLNGVGLTDIKFENVSEIVVTPKFAKQAVSTLAAKPSLGLFDLPKDKEEIGSLEGEFGTLGTWYDNPAISVIDARTGTVIWCVITESLRQKFADKANVEDFWQHKRVVVHGRIRYNVAGNINSVAATDVSRIESKSVSTSALHDSDFTDGLTTSEYLDRFRDGLIE
jgi:hypothetical protein